MICHHNFSIIIIIIHIFLLFGFDYFFGLLYFIYTSIYIYILQADYFKKYGKKMLIYIHALPPTLTRCGVLTSFLDS